MRIRFLAIAGALCVAASAVQAQSVAELRAQYEQTEAMLNDAEAAGMDAELTASLRESLDTLRQVIDDMERDQASSSTYSDETQYDEPEPEPEPVRPAEVDNHAADACSKLDFTETNYREKAFAAGDEQLRALCGQAYEYLAMYKRALDQGHPEAYRTYDAHKQAAAVVNNFYGEAKASPGEGIRPDTRTAADDAADAARRRAAAAASAPPRPPKAKLGNCPPECPVIPR